MPSTEGVDMQAAGADGANIQNAGADGSNMQAAGTGGADRRGVAGPDQADAAGQGMTAGAKAIYWGLSLTLVLVIAIGLTLAYKVSNSLNSVTGGDYFGHGDQGTSYEFETTQPSSEEVHDGTGTDDADIAGNSANNNANNNAADAVENFAVDNADALENSADSSSPETNADESTVVYIVTGDRVNVRPGPSADGEPMAKLSIGQLVKGTGQISDDGKWAEILLPDNEQEKGWVSLHYLQKQ